MAEVQAIAAAFDVSNPQQIEGCLHFAECPLPIVQYYVFFSCFRPTENKWYLVLKGRTTLDVQ